MRSLLILLASPALVLAQKLIDFSTLPSCANGCTYFKQAESGCVPPTALQSNMQTYFSCFCQSAFLQTFKVAPSAICTDVCSVADLTTIQTWYNSFCAGPPPQEQVVVTATRPSSPSATNPQGGTSTSAGAVPGGINPFGGPPKSWIESHYGWVIFIVLLFVLMVGGFIFGVWFRKRRARKEESRLAALAARNPSTAFSTHSRPMSTIDPPMTAMGTAGSRHSIISRSRTGTVSSFHSPVVWGPHQHQAHTNGYEYPLPPSSPVQSHPVPTPVYGPRFSRERLSSIMGDDAGDLPPPRTSASVNGPTAYGYPRSGTPQSAHRSREHVESRFVEADRGDGVDSTHNLADSDIEGAGHTLSKKQSRKLSKRSSKPS